MIPQPTTMLFSEINVRELSQVSQQYLKTDIETTCKAHEARNKRTNNNTKEVIMILNKPIQAHTFRA